MNTKRFFRTPKGLLIVCLAILVTIAGIGEGMALIAPGLVAACAGAMLVDAPILMVRRKRWVFPDGALLTGLIVAMVLTPHEPWYIAAAGGAIGVASKYVARAGKANIFNPAALGLIATYFLFDSGHSWWGALPELPMTATLAVLATGVFITDRVNKVPLVLAFLGVYYLLFTTAAYLGDPGSVAELYRAPDLHAALFFAFFMITDPPTSPPKLRDQVMNGIVVAVSAFVFFEAVGAVYFLLAGALVGNIWEAIRRVRARALRRAS